MYLSIFFSVGLLGFALPFTREYFLWLTGPVLWVGTAFLLIIVKPKNNFWLWFATGAVFTFFMEVLGVETGLVFGSYEYSEVLGFTLLKVPVIIGINWVIIIWGGEEMIYAKFPQWWSVFLVAAFGLLFDIIMEPVAIALDFWRWPMDIVPLQNYIAWFVLGLILSISARFLKPHQNKSFPTFYVFVLFGFFIVINAFIWFGLL
jgi:putative membrane protein